MAKITLADGMTIEGTAEELRELAKAFGEVAYPIEEAAEESAIGVGDIVRNEGVLYEVIGVREPGYLASEEGVTLKDPESPSEKSWKFAHNCEIVTKASDRKDV